MLVYSRRTSVSHNIICSQNKQEERLQTAAGRVLALLLPQMNESGEADRIVMCPDRFIGIKV